MPAPRVPVLISSSPLLLLRADASPTDGSPELSQMCAYKKFQRSQSNDEESHRGRGGGREGGGV